MDLYFTRYIDLIAILIFTLRKLKVVTIGGGTGTFTVLSGLKKYPEFDLSVIVSMMDDGGSNRVIRDEFGLLPTSDVRQCILALASNESDEVLRKLFTYRYSSGTGISGMTFGNLFMAALSDIYGGDQEKAIEETCKIFEVKGKVIPVTFEKTNLVARYENGKQILGEHAIDEINRKQGKYRIVNLEVIPQVEANKEALNEIKVADLIILGPGDLYTSTLSNVVVDGIAQAIQKSKAKVIYVMNLMTKFGQTGKFKASDFISEVEKYIGKDRVNYCLINNSINIPPKILRKYREELSEPVIDDLDSKYKKMKISRRNLISDVIYEKPKSDKLTRSLARHDSDKIARAIKKLLATS